MEQKIDLRKLERNTAAVIFQTGIVDIGIGLVFLVSSLAFIFDDIRYYIDILFIMPPIFIFLAKKYLVDPRIGVVELRKKRVRKNMFVIIAITLFLVIMVSLTLFGSSNGKLELINGRWIITGIIFFICTAVAYFLEFQRMYIYAFLISGAFNLSEFIREHPGFISENGIAYLMVSILLILVGSFYLTSFLKKNQIPNE